MALLDEAGWVDSDDDGIRDRDGRNLTFSLEASNDTLMAAIADQIAADWAAIGVEAVRRNLDQRSTVENLTNRAFHAMLFGWERRDYDPDPYPLWHSSQAEDGQNFAGWRNPDADAIMVRARRAHPDDLDGRAALYYEFQRMFADDEPALMLYHPVYAYAVVDPNLGGIQLPQLLVEPADRYLTLSDWFTQTERVFRATGGRTSQAEP
jgi:peptide/nickel transport system substrate-binding protein